MAAVQPRLHAPRHVLQRLGVSRKALLDICRQYHIQKLTFFGSVLTEQFRPDSDVDVLVEFASEPSLSDLVRAQSTLEHLFGRKVDLVNARAILNPFRRYHILTRGGLPITPQQRVPSLLWDMHWTAQRIQDILTSTPSSAEIPPDLHARILQDALIFEIKRFTWLAGRVPQVCHPDYPQIPWETLAAWHRDLDRDDLDLTFDPDQIAHMATAILNLIPTLESLIPPLPETNGGHHEPTNVHRP
ncbi:nucleotidyltransferase family protein [Thermanaerothrix sp.]|uniref:nucleotidyltransferase family protein n=1 Tax=Thermanaerothrix sp. TaxID=2972675 RepID=UPI002ADD47BB|nr:nucleotidyltransferase family protein [Thermanaerothrix sp.]